MNLEKLTIETATADLRAKKISSEELTRECLKEIKRRDNELGAFLTVDEAGALLAARAADARLASDAAERLTGIPLAIKDNILVAGLQATAGSRILEKYRAAYDATVVTCLKKAGVVIIGKTNLDEFGMGSSTENSAFQSTKNPWDTSRVPGGSSGGSAVAVATGMALGALGTDTGGSIRQPASLTGVVGLKPTYGRVSRYGAIALASSLEQIGPFAKSVWDVAAILEAIEGPDARDATAVRDIETVVPELLPTSIRGKRIGVPKEYFIAGMDPLVEKAVRRAIEQMEEMGAEIVNISLPLSEYALAVYYIVMPAEASANLARYDGVRYGTRLDGVNLDEVYRETRGQLFGAEVKRRIMIGSYVLSAGYQDAYYRKAQQVRALISRDFDRVFKQVDCIVSPTSPSVAFKFGEKVADSIAMYLSDIYTVSANLAGLPGISVPCGLAHGLPVGLQLMAKPFDEANLLSVANVYEKQTDWRAQRFD